MWTTRPPVSFRFLRQVTLPTALVEADYPPLFDSAFFAFRLKESKLHNHFGGLMPHSFIIPTAIRT
jgi:hypothetical protein